MSRRISVSSTSPLGPIGVGRPVALARVAAYRSAVLVGLGAAWLAACGGAPSPAPVVAGPAAPPPPAPSPARQRVVVVLSAAADDEPYEAFVDDLRAVPWMRDVSLGLALNHDLRFRAVRGSLTGAPPAPREPGAASATTDGEDVFVDAARPTPRRNPWDLTGRIELVELTVEGEWGPRQEPSQTTTRWLVAEATDLSGTERWPASITGQRARVEAELQRLTTRHTPTLQDVARAQLPSAEGGPPWQVRATRIELGPAEATYRSASDRVALRQTSTLVLEAQRTLTGYRACSRCPRGTPCPRCGSESRVEEATARASLTATYLLAPDGGVALESLELPEAG